MSTTRTQQIVGAAAVRRGVVRGRSSSPYHPATATTTPSPAVAPMTAPSERRHVVHHPASLSSRWSSKPCSRSFVRRWSVRCGWGMPRPSGPGTNSRFSCTSAPFQPATSQISVTARRPCRSRPRWTKKSTASEISSAAIGKSTASVPWATYWASFFHADERRVVVHGRQARMAVLHRQQHLAGRVAVADLADDQPVRVEPQGVADQLALGDLADALDVGLPRLPLQHRRGARRVGAQVELARVLDDDDAGVGCEHVRHRPHERRLAGTGLAGDDHPHAGAHDRRRAASASPGRSCRAPRARRATRRAARCAGWRPAARSRRS